MKLVQDDDMGSTRKSRFSAIAQELDEFEYKFTSAGEILLFLYFFSILK